MGKKSYEGGSQTLTCGLSNTSALRLEDYAVTRIYTQRTGNPPHLSFPRAEGNGGYYST